MFIAVCGRHQAVNSCEISLLLIFSHHAAQYTLCNGNSLWMSSYAASFTRWIAFFFVVDTCLCKNTHLIEFLCWLQCIFSTDFCKSIAYEQERATVSHCVRKKTDCYNRLFIFLPIIGEPIWECEWNTYKRPVSCLQALGTDCVCLTVCLSVGREEQEVTHSLQDKSCRKQGRKIITRKQGRPL